MRSIRSTRQRSRGSTELNIAPLIDMVFILLIFFLVTTSFVKESGVEVQRPVAQSAEDQKTTLIIGVTPENRIYMEGKPIDVRSVQAHVERFALKNPGGNVVIAADKESRSGIVIQVLDACRLAGVRDVAVAASRPG
ncbi:MAG: biopolymer transporter ExbD [Desulfovermiculus sp.]|jgi:biopolymer transport protein ExbD